SPARSTGTTTISDPMARPSAGPSGVSTVVLRLGTSRMASAASSTLMRVAARRNESGGVRLSRSVINASWTMGCWTRWTGTAPLYLLFAEDGDVRQIAVLLGVVESVPDHESIFDAEPDVLDLHVHLAARRLAQKAGRLERARPAGVQNVL